MSRKKLEEVTERIIGIPIRSYRQLAWFGIQALLGVVVLYVCLFGMIIFFGAIESFCIGGI